LAPWLALWKDLPVANGSQQWPVDIHFWEKADEFVSISTLEIDRPRGSAHPRQPQVVYPLDYGHLVETVGGDREWVDVWRGSSNDQRVVACAATVDLFRRNCEMKLVLACTPDEVDVIQDFYRKRHLGTLLIRRPAENQTSAPT
jgi:inorganic pyrophosphatase